MNGASEKTGKKKGPAFAGPLESSRNAKAIYLFPPPPLVILGSRIFTPAGPFTATAY